MKTILTLFSITLLSLNSFSQQVKNMTIFKTDSSQIKTSGIFIYENDFIKNIRFENSNLNNSNLENIAKVIVDEKIYIVKDYGWKRYLFLQILNGELSLYKSKSDYYLENNKFGLKEIAKKEYLNYPVFRTGTVSLFINNCNLAVNKLQQNVTNLTLENLKNIIEIYNSCDLETEIQIADQIMKKSMKPIEKIEFGASLGLMNLKADYSNIIEIPTSNLSLVSVGAKIYFHSNMLDKNLDFNISVDYFMEGKQKSNSTEYTLYSKTQLMKTMISTNYLFYNLSENIKPYIGFSAGLIFNSNSSILLIPKSNELPSKSYNANNELTYNINAGAVFNILNQKFDFLIEYQPNLDMSILKTSSLNTEKNSYNITGVNFRLTYIF